MSMTMTRLPELSDQETKVYLAGLELGTDTIQHLAQKAQLPRSTTYLIIDDLVKKGLVSLSKSKKKSLFSTEPPEKLLSLLNQKQASITEERLALLEAMPRLKALQNSRENKPLVSFYEGFEGIKTILEKSLQAREILVICSGYQKPMNTAIEKYMNEEYLPKTNKLSIKTREMVTNDPDIVKYRKMYESADHIIKVSRRQPASEHLDKLIFGDTVALVAYDVLNGTVIEHPQVARFEKALFEEVWNKI